MSAHKTKSVEFWAYCRENTTKHFRVTRHNVFGIVMAVFVLPLLTFRALRAEAEHQDKKLGLTNRKYLG